MKRSTGEIVLNILAFIAVITTNALANALPIAGKTTGAVSDSYPSLFTPAGFTFSIWGLIYLGLLSFVIFQALPGQRENESIAKISRIFVLNCAANCLWLIFWHYELLPFSLLIMLIILLTLIFIYKRLGIGREKVPAGEYLTVHLPFSLYIGWITVATIANFSALQIGMGWDNWMLEAIPWTLIKLGIAGAIGVWMVLQYRDLVFAGVIAWAAYGISVKQESILQVNGAAVLLVVLCLALILMSSVRFLFDKLASD